MFWHLKLNRVYVFGLESGKWFELVCIQNVFQEIKFKFYIRSLLFSLGMRQILHDVWHFWNSWINNWMKRENLFLLHPQSSFLINRMKQSKNKSFAFWQYQINWMNENGATLKKKEMPSIFFLLMQNPQTFARTRKFIIQYICSVDCCW